MTPSGLFQVAADRGASVGLPDLHPHQFRHSFADAWLSAGGSKATLRPARMASKASIGVPSGLAWVLSINGGIAPTSTALATRAVP